VEGLESVDEDDACDGGETIEMDMGQCTVRPGGIRHCGNPLQKGVRYIIGGFCMSKKRIETVRQLLATSNNKEGLEVAIKLNPKFDGVYPSVAHHYENEGKLEKSIQILEDCLKLANPISSTASYYLGTIYYKREQWEKAKICMDTCLTVDKNDGDALGTLVRFIPFCIFLSFIITTLY
jgi:tetratricopeptide (TPR) repeat protein